MVRRNNNPQFKKGMKVEFESTPGIPYLVQAVRAGHYILLTPIDDSGIQYQPISVHDSQLQEFKDPLN